MTDHGPADGTVAESADGRADSGRQHLAEHQCTAFGDELHDEALHQGIVHAVDPRNAAGQQIAPVLRRMTHALLDDIHPGISEHHRQHQRPPAFLVLGGDAVHGGHGEGVHRRCLEEEGGFRAHGRDRGEGAHTRYRRSGADRGPATGDGGEVDLLQPLQEFGRTVVRVGPAEPVDIFRHRGSLHLCPVVQQRPHGLLHAAVEHR